MPMPIDSPQQDAMLRWDEVPPAFFDEIDRVLEEALARPADTREAYVASACAHDDTLLWNVIALVRASAGVHPVLETPPDTLLAALAEGLPDRQRDLEHGDRVGPYKIERELGRGGMGTVYLARRADGAYERQVALKVVRSGLGGDELQRRFQRERRILAQLQHPNIAQMHGGGVTPEGRLYFAMAYVEGTPITAFCDAHRLGLDARLRLFEQVCEAVQSAHQRLVVHRDLKPSNILVSLDAANKPRARLLDFGIAKPLAEHDTEHDAELGGLEEMAPHDEAMPSLTRAGAHPMTREYAAPEQLAGEAVTVSSDLYALGIVAYELIVGARPDGAGALPSERVTQPRADALGFGSITALRRTIRRDLDLVIAKALEPEPRDRYATVAAFADDLKRFREGEVVTAHPPSSRYRASKFIARNRLLVSVAAVAVLAVAVSVGALVAKQGDLVAERNAARAEAEKARAVSDYVVGLFEAADPAQSKGADVTARELLAAGAEQADALNDQPETRGTMLHTLARVHYGLGEYDAAKDLAGDAVTVRRALDEAARGDLAESLTLAGTIAWEQGAHEASDSAFTQALAVLAAPTSPADVRLRSDALLGFAILRQAQGRFPETDSLLRAAIHLRRDVLSAAPDEELVSAYITLGLSRVQESRYAEADSAYTVGIDLARQVHGDDHPQLTTALYNAGMLAQRMGRYDEAEPLLREVLALDRTQLGDRHPYVAYSLGALAVVLRRLERHTEAEPLLVEAVSINREAHGEVHPQTAAKLQDLAGLLSETGRHAEAIEQYEAALASFRQIHGEAHASIATVLRNLGQAHRRAGSPTRAEEVLGEALAMGIDVLGETHSDNGITLVWLGDAYGAQALTAQARTAYERGLVILEATLPEGHPRIASARQRLEAL